MFVADFETTTDVDDCRVWAWGIINITDLTDLKIVKAGAGAITATAAATTNKDVILFTLLNIFFPPLISNFIVLKPIIYETGTLCK